MPPAGLRPRRIRHPGPAARRADRRAAQRAGPHRGQRPLGPPAPGRQPAAEWRGAATRLLDRALDHPCQPAAGRIPTRGKYAATDATGRTHDEAAFERAVREQAPTAVLRWGSRTGHGRLVQVTFLHPASGYLGQPAGRVAPDGPSAIRPSLGEGTLIGKLAALWQDS